MFEKIDKRVLMLSLVGGVVGIFVAYNYGTDNCYNTIVSIVFSVPIFFLFLFDKDYTLGYYVLYVVVCRISVFFLQQTLRKLVKVLFDMFGIKIHSYSGLINFIYFQTFIFVVIGAFITAFLFQLFKKKSYLKHKNKIINEELD